MPNLEGFLPLPVLVIVKAVSKNLEGNKRYYLLSKRRVLGRKILKRPTPSKNNGKKVAVGVGTRENGLLLVSDSERKKWKKIGPFLQGESVNCIRYEPKSGRLYAATHTNGVFVSTDFGKTWKQSNEGLHVKKAWTLEFDRKNPKTMYVGTQYGHLFKSSNSGASWEEVTGLFDAPKRNEWGVDWGFGTVGLCIHTIRMDPKERSRFYIVSSGAGPYRTDDLGKNWALLNKGVMEDCPSESATADVSGLGNDPAKNKAMHLEQVHRCTHKLAVSRESPGTIFQQNHCGVYRSLDSGATWEDVSPDVDQRHGFSLALIEGVGNGGAIFTIPATQSPCKKHNSCIQGQLVVCRSKDSGKTWEKLTEGLPGKNNHTCVLRDAMGYDSLNEPGLYFGTTTGEVYGTTNLGENWSMLQSNAGRVQGVNAFEF